jgi:hypothetical protein
VPAALVFLALAGFAGFALLGLCHVTLGAALGVVFLAPAIFFLAAASIGKRAGAGVALLIGERAQHDAGARRV